MLRCHARFFSHSEVHRLKNRRLEPDLNDRESPRVELAREGAVLQETQKLSVDSEALGDEAQRGQSQDLVFSTRFFPVKFTFHGDVAVQQFSFSMSERGSFVTGRDNSVEVRRFIRAQAASSYECGLVAKDLAAVGRLLVTLSDDALEVEMMDVAPERSGQRSVELVVRGGDLDGLIDATTKSSDVTLVAVTPVAPARSTKGEDADESGDEDLSDPDDRGEPRSPTGAPDIDGKIIAVTDQDWRCVVILNRGKYHGVRKGMQFDVYRGSTYKGKFEVDSVQTWTSWGHPVHSGSDSDRQIETGDSATTHL